MNQHPHPSGFTLVEAIVVLAIVGILAAIAYPSYTEQVRSGRRADAEGALYGLQQALERLFTTHSSYATAALGSAPGSIFSDQVPADGPPNYQLQIADLTATGYTLKAVPVGVQAHDRCGTLTLSSANVRGIANALPGLAVADCWRN